MTRRKDGRAPWIGVLPTAALAVACSCSRSPAVDPIVGPADASAALAPAALLDRPPRPAWTVATTLAAPPVKHATGVADVVAHVPSGYEPRAPIHLVLFFHGSGQCIAQLALGGDVVCTPGGKPDVGAGVAFRHDDAGTMTVFAAPQMALWGGGGTGRFSERGYLRTFIEELLRDTFAPGLDGPRTVDDVAGITLVAHSAGYVPVLEILRRKEWDDAIENVVLLDAFFATGVDELASWIERGRAKALKRKVVAVYGAWGNNVENGRALAARIERQAPGSAVIDPPGDLATAARSHVVTVKLWRHVEHAWMLLLTMSKALAGLGLPPRAVWPPNEPIEKAGRSFHPAITVGEAMRGTIDTGDERLQNGALSDTFDIVLERDQKVTIEALGGASFTEPCCSLDVVLRLSRGANGANGAHGANVLAEDDDSAGGFDSRLQFAAPVAGAYTVRVSTYGAGERRGPYTLHAF